MCLRIISKEGLLSAQFSCELMNCQVKPRNLIDFCSKERSESLPILFQMCVCPLMVFATLFCVSFSGVFLDYRLDLFDLHRAYQAFCWVHFLLGCNED